MSKSKYLINSGAVIFGFTALVACMYVFISSSQKPLCNNKSCINLDARYKNCARDAKTLFSEKFKETTITLRYSASCNASWSKAEVPVGSILYVEDAQGTIYGDNYTVPNDSIPGAHYGNMGPGKNLKACVKIPVNKHLCTQFPPQS